MDPHRHMRRLDTALHSTFLSDPKVIGDPYEIRTRVAGVRGRSLRPLDQRAVFLVHHQGLEPWTP